MSNCPKEDPAPTHAPDVSFWHHGHTYTAEVAVIVPVHGHPSLMSDALDSILAQPESPRILGLVINDGCRHAETHWTCLEYAASHPHRLIYLQQANQGSAAARNTAIEWVLREVSDLEAVYFLDADNMLIEGGIAEALDKLRSTGADFVYPPYNAVGVYHAHDQLHPFSPTQLLRFNYIDTGSLVHSRVLVDGVRFDPAMKGFEDWDFWLSAVSRNYRGVYAGDLGLIYRKRPESQLTDHDLSRPEAVSEIIHKQKQLYNPARQIELGASERSRYAIFLSGSHIINTSFINDPGKTITKKDMEQILWRSIVSCHDLDAPAFYIWISDELWETLKRLRLLAWLLVDAERALRSNAIYGVCVQADAQIGEVQVDWAGSSLVHAGMIVIRSDVVQAIMKDTSTGWVGGLILAPEAPKDVRLRTLKIPESERGNVRRVGTAVIDDLVAFHTSSFRASAKVNWGSKSSATVPARSRYTLLTGIYEAAAPLPYLPTDREIVFALPYAEFGGADRVSYNMAFALRQMGWTPHLVVTNRSWIRLPAEFATTFETVSFLDHQAAAEWGGNGFYLGTGLPAWGGGGDWVKLWELVWFCSAFINNHSSAANVLVGRLKKSGVSTFCHLHLVDVDATGHHGGHPMLALAYERGYVGLLGCSREICDWLVAQSVPVDKVIEIRNGPGFLVGQYRARELVAERESRDSTQLRVLYLGRLDRQKGLDALTEVHKASVVNKMPVVWRIVGDSMVDSGPTLSKSFRAALEPAVFDRDDVLDVLAWADVIVLLSDYEGLPLVLIEAMLCGVVPISTNVGAVGELITDGYDGFLISTEHREREALAALELLCSDRERLWAMTRAAHETGVARNNWTGAVQPLIEAIDAHKASLKMVDMDQPTGCAANAVCS